MSQNEGTSLESTVSEIVSRIEARNAAREQALTESRQLIRFAANSIRAIHRQENDQALNILAQGQQRLETIKKVLAGYPEIYWAGYVQDAQKEYAEARLTYALIRSEPLPNPQDLGVEDAPYLNGLAEAASELRRYILDILRHGQESSARSEELLDRMDEVYSLLVTVDYPDALTGGLRRTTDQLRGVLEKTRGDFTLTLRHQILEAALERAANKSGQ
jgi:translin